MPDTDLTNYRSGISAWWGDSKTTATDKGIGYMEEYLYSDKITNDRKVVYIRSDTDITLETNDINSWSDSSTGSYFPIIGASGGGVIRYKIDQDMRHDRGWSGSYGSLVLNPTYSGPFSLDDLTYPDSSVPVVGTVGDNGGDISSKTDYWWRGMLDSFGDEWHVLTVAHDDDLLTSDPEKKAGDGKLFWLVVNPKTPGLTITSTGNAQFYTTPPKIYFVPKIINQITYFNEGTGTVSFEIRNLYSGNVFYRIGGTGPFTDAGANNVILNQDHFSDGINTLEYYYAGNSDYTKTRIVVKNPTHPSLEEDHGYLVFGDSAGLQIAKDNADKSPYNNYYNLLKTNSYWNKHQEWDSLANQGHRYNYSGHPANPTAIAPNAFVALKEGFTYTKVGESKSFGEYSKEMLLQNMRTIDPVGFEIRHDGYPVPARELFNRGYYDVNPILDSMLAYDIFAGHLRDDQVTGGLTAIEDYYFRDLMAEFVVEALKWMQNGTGIPPGMWGSARNCGAIMIGIYMPSYQSDLYGTSGFDGVSTESGTWKPYPTTQGTWKEHLWDDNLSLTAYPNIAYRSDPAEHVVVIDTENTYFQHWREKILYMDFGLMGRPLNYLLNVSYRYDPTKNYDLISGLFTKSFANELRGVHPFTGELYPGSSGPVGYDYPLLANESVDQWQAGWDSFDSALVSDQESKIRGAQIVAFSWIKPNFSPPIKKESSTSNSLLI